MKKLLRRLIIFIVIVCAYLLIKQKTTRLGTTIQTGDIAPATGVVITGIDLTNCVSYFDGCNTCTVKDGKADACTLMYCETPSEPKCLQYATGTEVTLTIEQTIVKTTSTYIVKIATGNDIPGENIHVYDTLDNQIFSLIATNDPSLQWFQDFSGDTLLVDYGTSPDIRSFIAYNIKTQQKLFESSYTPLHEEKSNGLYIEGNKVHFATLVFSKRSNDGKRQIPQPKTLPVCPSDRGVDSLGYSELRTFDITTNKVEKTGKVVCVFLQ